MAYALALRRNQFRVVVENSEREFCTKPPVVFIETRIFYSLLLNGDTL